MGGDCPSTARLFWLEIGRLETMFKGEPEVARYYRQLVDLRKDIVDIHDVIHENLLLFATLEVTS